MRPEIYLKGCTSEFRNVRCLLAVTLADMSNLYAELARVRQSMYFRFSAAHCTYIWMLANRCYTTVLQWTSEWSLPCGPTFYPGQSLFLLIHVSKYNILLQRYPPRKSSATQLVANLQCLCIWLLVLPGKIFRVFRMVRSWSAHGMWWLSFQKTELDQPWADFNMQAHANALTMFALVARGWKMKMDI